MSLTGAGTAANPTKEVKHSSSAVLLQLLLCLRGSHHCSTANSCLTIPIPLKFPPPAVITLPRTFAFFYLQAEVFREKLGTLSTTLVLQGNASLWPGLRDFSVYPECSDSCSLCSTSVETLLIAFPWQFVAAFPISGQTWQCKERLGSKGNFT